jgi:hypothetical protein
MKKNLRSFILLLFLTSVFEGAVAIPSNASEPCFSNIPDSAWTYISPESTEYPYPGIQPVGFFNPPSEVRSEIGKSPQDYVYKTQMQISKSGGDWTALSEKIDRDFRLPLVPGNKYRNVITYEGRKCAKRIVYLPELIVANGKTPTLTEYVSKTSNNFQEEGEFLARLTKPFPINFSAKEVKVGDKVYVNDNPEIQNLRSKGYQHRNTLVTIDFKDGCAKVSFSGDWGKLRDWEKIFPSTYRYNANYRPPFEFIKSGVCIGDVYSYAIEGDLLPFLIGTIEYKVQISNSTSKPGITSKKTTITCVKGKVTKKITGKPPKCPPGYKAS